MFLNSPTGLKQGDAIRVLIGANPSGSASINNVRLLAAPSSVGVLGQFNSYDAASAALTIQSGDFVVGFSSANPSNVAPAALDITDSKQRSYASTDGLNFQQLMGNLAIRATVD